MNIKLYEGKVVQSGKFVNGLLEDGKLLVGNYVENSILDFSKGERQNDYARATKKYVITQCLEIKQELNVGGNTLTTYSNEYVAKELNEDGTYNENGEEIHFTTSANQRGAIDELDIIVVKTMKKVFI